ncbi:MAG: TerB family tellurite resistance protein [Weeksellaceae bacterium]
MIRFIIAVFGFILTGFNWLGGLMGYVAGTFIEGMVNVFTTQQESPEASYDYYRRTNSTDDYTYMLMALSAAVMRADGNAMKSELNYVKAFFKRNLGNRFQVNHLQMLKHFLNTPGIPLDKICTSIRVVTKLADRVLLLHYLFGIAAANGRVSPSEIDVIQKISNLLGISSTDFQSAKNMVVRETDSDYKVIGVEKSATNEEIKKAYRELALRYHPDRVAHLGEEYQKGAKEQFQKIQEAYENIKKQRGMT